MSAFSFDLHAAARRHAHTCPGTAGGLLPLLHDIQDHLGHIPPECVEVIAPYFNRSRAEVHGVISFYHHFKTTPPAPHTLQVCMAESCKACGGDDLADMASRVLGTPMGGVSASGRVQLEPVYCLGLCAMSPAVVMDDQVKARVTPDQLRTTLQQWEAQP